MQDYEMRIGLEVHCELKTASKLFCSCENAFGGKPNTRCCPVCTGYPGALPSLNAKAVKLTVAAGLALGCEISDYCKWDRKNYFYPDLPKGWQTTQYDLPLVKGGIMAYESGDVKKQLRISRIQLEEDAGKLVHDGEKTFVDFNRCGVPLIEIVTEPDLRSPEDAAAALEEIRTRLKFAGVSDVKMQEGSLRCDVNLSVSLRGGPMGVRTETKNLNSIKAVQRCCRYEAERQKRELLAGGKITLETRKWDDARGIGYAMRGKEESRDYKYIAEVDVPPVTISEAFVRETERSLPPSKASRKAKYTAEYALPEYDADVLTSDCVISDLFDDAVKCGADPKKASNFIMGSVLRLSKTEGSDDYDVKIGGDRIAQCLKLCDDGEISMTVLKEKVLPELWGTDLSPSDVINQKGLRRLPYEETAAIAQKVIEENPAAVSEYLSGNSKVFSFLVGKVMKAGAGKCDPTHVNETLNKKIKEKEKER